VFKLALANQPKQLTFKVAIQVEADERSYHAWCPALKGLHAGGRSREEALARAHELAELYLETLIDDGDPIPVGVK